MKYSSFSVDQVGINERAAKFTKRSIKGDAKAFGLKLAVSMMDLTTLEGADTSGKLRYLCQKAVSPMPHPSLCPACAAVCVYPNLVGEAKILLSGSGVRVASVATSFPSGQVPLETRLDEVRYAVSEGADEIDMVIARGAFLRGDLNRVAKEIKSVRRVCGKAHLKVIFETGEIGAYDKIRLASDIAMQNGAHFLLRPLNLWGAADHRRPRRPRRRSPRWASRWSPRERRRGIPRSHRSASRPSGASTVHARWAASRPCPTRLPPTVLRHCCVHKRGCKRLH